MGFIRNNSYSGLLPMNFKKIGVHCTVKIFASLGNFPMKERVSKGERHIKNKKENISSPLHSVHI